MAATYTPNFNLGKQTNHADKFDMNIITENMDKIDNAMQGLLTASVDLEEQVVQKVDKIAGMGLISDEEKQKLSDLENYDDTEIKAEITNTKERLAALEEKFAALEGGGT